MGGDSVRPKRPAALAFAVCVAALHFAGCYSTSPLDATPQLPLDAALLGSWRCISAEARADGAASASLSPMPGKEREYGMKWRDVGETDAGSYRAHLSSVRGDTYLSVWGPEGSEYAGWLFLRYSFLRKDILYVEAVPGEPFEDKKASVSAAAARATLEAALAANPATVQEFCVCRRLAEEPAKPEE